MAWPAVAGRGSRRGTAGMSAPAGDAAVLVRGDGPVRAQIELDAHRAYDLTKAVMAMNARADDAHAGMCAFPEKRTPAWHGR